MELPVKYGELSFARKRKVRAEYVRLQEGLCFHCKENLSFSPPVWISKKPINWKRFPNEFLKYPIHLHHNHNTGMTEGAVHAYCNAVLWQYHGK